jgi:hypothetical protein
MPSVAAGPEMKRTHLERDARRDAPCEDLVALTDEVLRCRDGLGRIACVVGKRQLDLAAVDAVLALRRVREPVAEALDVLGAVRREQPRARIDDADLVRIGLVRGDRGAGREPECRYDGGERGSRSDPVPPVH